MSEVYFDAREAERTQRRAERVERLIVGDTWMRERMSSEAVAAVHEGFSDSES